MKNKSIVFLLLLGYGIIFCEVKNLILMIGDGMGLAITDLARIIIVGKDQYLNFEKFPVVGIVKTYSDESLVTDSAAAATAMSCGVKTKNSFLGLTTDGVVVENLVEKIKKTGRTVGLVTTVTITHATPAGFAVHINSRDEKQVAKQYVELKNVDVLLGGGRYLSVYTKEFINAGYTVVTTRDELLSLDTKLVTKLTGLFNDIDSVYYIDKNFLQRDDIPSLSELSKTAIEVLSKNKKGFFLLIEAGRIDWACHDNDAATAINEIKEFDDAVAMVVETIKQKKLLQDTLIIITSDHETGGLSLGTGEYRFYPEKISKQKISIKKIGEELKGQPKEIIIQKFEEYTGIADLTEEEILQISKGNRKEISRIISSRAEIGWSTSVHSGMSVPIYAMGKNSEIFSGVYDNTDIFKKIIQVMNLK
ncbi:MAG: alkaline phosphatase [Endomicrobia bacterium]|nr:alkaline phosphatase [Endomicrobiia bacterium]MDW8055819.1 alkaline phosphatase [Elusimicrobiota bacterium]